MRGYTLVELLIVLLVAVAVCAMSIPVVGYAIEEGRLRGAAFYLSSRLALLRMQAVRRFANVALRFKYDGVKYRYQTFGDGDGDGVKSGDQARRGAARGQSAASCFDSLKGHRIYENAPFGPGQETRDNTP